MKFYPLGDLITRSETEALANAKDVRAVSTGIKRAPRKGERYLSGAIPHAYRAPNDLSSEYLIAKLVAVKQILVAVK